MDKHICNICHKEIKDYDDLMSAMICYQGNIYHAKCSNQINQKTIDEMYDYCDNCCNEGEVEE
jgi:hypothetical protein